MGWVFGTGHKIDLIEGDKGCVGIVRYGWGDKFEKSFRMLRNDASFFGEKGEDRPRKKLNLAVGPIDGDG